MPNPFLDYDPTVPPEKRKFPEPLVRLGDSLDGPGDPRNVFLIFRESELLAWLEECDPAKERHDLQNIAAKTAGNAALASNQDRAREVIDPASEPEA